MLNQQAPEKRVYTLDRLAVHSIFDTIQGEGPFCGTPAVFVRLAGCNLQCPQCDTDYTSKRTVMSPEVIVSFVRSATGRVGGLVVITGGEPFRQDISALVALLVMEGYYVQVETNGTLPPPIRTTPFFSTDIGARRGAYLVVSPKTGRVHPTTQGVSCCYKYVMSADCMHPEDGLPVFALDHTAEPMLARPPVNYRRPVYLQPVDVKDPAQNERHLYACLNSCKRYGYILQLQIHKLLGVE
jgi:7-carboxy-7-deazaguanine synthase